MSALQMIPPITEPLGRYWEQPDRSLIEVDDTHAMMAPSTLEALADYSFSCPSGAYEGKMWRTAHGGEWYLNWFGASAQAGMVCHRRRKIIIVGGKS